VKTEHANGLYKKGLFSVNLKQRTGQKTLYRNLADGSILLTAMKKFSSSLVFLCLFVSALLLASYQDVEAFIPQPENVKTGRLLKKSEVKINSFVTTLLQTRNS